MTDEAKAGAVAMREFISGVIERYAEGCDANEDKEAGRVAAHVARSIGRLVEIIPPGSVVKQDRSPEDV